MKNTLLILLLSLTSFLNAQITDLGLIAYYDFENNANNQFSGNSGYNLTNFGVPPAILNNGDGVNGSNCYTFFGNGGLRSSEFYNLFQNNPNQSLSISLWAKDELPSGNQLGSMFEFFESMFIRGNSLLTLGINTSSNNATFNFFNDGSYAQGNSFQHHVLVFDHINQNLLYYRNGQLIGQLNTTSSTINKINQNAVFGGGVDAGGNFSNSKGFIGKIDEIYVYNRPLTQPEVTSLYNLETPQPADSISGDNLLAYYSFDGTTFNQAPGSSQFNLSIIGNTTLPPVSSIGISGGAIDNVTAYTFSGSSALATDDFDAYFASSPSQDISVSMWLNSSTIGTFRTSIEMFSSLFLRGVGEYGISTFNGAFSVNQNDVLRNSQWQHVSLVYNSQANTLQFYLNGALQSSTTTSTGTIFRYNSKTVIGGGTNGDGSVNPSKYFGGTIDEVYIFNRVLTPGEVAAFANKLVPTPPAPSCPTGDVTLSNQSEVNDFVAQYSSCTTIDGNLTITGSVSDLSSLTGITMVNGNLEIINTSLLSGLNGLQNISSVSGDLRVIGNTSLANIDQLANITTVARLDIWFNPLLQNISGLSGLVNVSNNIFIDSNDSLTSLNGLQGLSGTHPASISIDNNNALTSLNGLQNIVQISGRLRLRDNALLSDISALSNFQGSGVLFSLALLIENNDALISLNGLQNYTNANNNTVRIEENDNLADVSALANLNPNSVANLTILNNPSLATCNINFVCDFVINTPANATISGNATGCTNLTEVQAACAASNPPCPPASVSFNTQAELDAYLLQYPNCDTINGDVFITGTVNNLSGLTSLTTITGTLQFVFPTSITSLNGLENLANVNTIILNGLTGISNLNEFSNLTGVGRIIISNCDALTDITGLSGITTINEELFLFNNNALQNLNGLQNLTTTASNIFTTISIENNDVLTDISALNNLDFQNVNLLRIKDNPVLQTCTSDFVCDYLDNLNANRLTDIVNNASGCNSVAEVQTACAAIPPTCPTGNVTLNSQADVDNFVLQFPNCDIINGNLRLANGNITDITGLINITQITGLLDIIDLPLQNLDGLNSLVSVGNRILILLNPNLESVASLERLESTFEISINQNNNLTEISLPRLQNIPNGIFIDENASLNSIAGLSNLSNGNIGPISITENPVLENLNGLENVQSVTNMFIWANTNLNDISAIANIPYLNVGVLTILDNTSLSVCTNTLVCDMIVNSRNISILGNAPGCSDLAEVSNSCSTLSANQFEQTEMKTYPNPFTDAINIQLPLGVDKATVKIMNIEGKVVYATELNSNQSTINELQTLSKGVYLMQLTFESGQVATYKIIK